MSEGDRAIAGLVVGVIFAVLIALFWIALPKCEDTLLESHPTWTASDRQLVCDGRIRVGMVRSQVRLAWGAPNATQTRLSEAGVSEVWIYRRVGATSKASDWLATSYVYFEDGVVSTIIKGGLSGN